MPVFVFKKCLDEMFPDYETRSAGAAKTRDSPGFAHRIALHKDVLNSALFLNAFTWNSTF